MTVRTDPTSSSIHQLNLLAQQHNREQHPNVPEHARTVRKYEDRTANGLTRCIIDQCRFDGHYAVRINSMGIYNAITGKWRPSGTTPGTADIHLCINGVHISVEVKIGRDRMSKEQLTCKAEVEKSGGVYFIASSFDQFMKFYRSLINKKPASK